MVLAKPLPFHALQMPTDSSTALSNVHRYRDMELSKCVCHTGHSCTLPKKPCCQVLLANCRAN